jgi:hypothetical protein
MIFSVARYVTNLEPYAQTRSLKETHKVFVGKHVNLPVISKHIQNIMKRGTEMCSVVDNNILYNWII